MPPALAPGEDEALAVASGLSGEVSGKEEAASARGAEGWGDRWAAAAPRDIVAPWPGGGHLDVLYIFGERSRASVKPGGLDSQNKDAGRVLKAIWSLLSQRVLCCVGLSHSVMSGSLQPHGLQPARGA